MKLSHFPFASRSPTALVFSAALLVFASTAPAATITTPGFTLGVAGDSNDQADAWRSTGVAKTFDPDGNNSYGTAGYVLYATDTLVNGNAGSVPTVDPLTYAPDSRKTISSIPSFLTLTNNGQNAIASSYGYPAIDDPLGPGGAAVSDLEAGLGITNNIVLGVEASLMNITVGAGFPAQGLRIGVMTGAGGDAPTTIRLTQTAGVGAGTATWSNVDRDGLFDLYFFNITQAAPGDVFTLYMAKPAAGPGNANLTYAGVFFDIPEPGATALLALSFAGLALRRKRS